MAYENVLITGASSGIGREMARQLASPERRLFLVARSESRLDSLASELKETSRCEAHVLPHDLASPAVPERIAEHLRTRGTEIDLLINNAGFGALGGFADLGSKRQVEMVQVNVAALTHLTSLLLPGMIARQKGGILNVASTAAFAPGPRMAVYYATKAFVLSFSEALAEELRGSGVTVSCLCPGPTVTAFAAAAGMADAKLFRVGAMQAQEVALTGIEGLRRGRTVVVPGWKNKLSAFSVRLTPRRVVRRVVRALQG